MDKARLVKAEETLGFVLESKLALSKINLTRGTEYTWLKPLQTKSIQAALENDAIIILPTGYGKSLIFEIIPLIKDSKVIVVSPLNVIIDEQTARLGSEKVLRVTPKMAKYLRTTHEGDVQVFSKHSIIIGHPEDLLKKEVCDSLMHINNVSHIFVDEAHCVVTWGKDFRPEFQKVSKLRAIFPSAKLVAMTATATVKMQKEIAQILCIRDYKSISCSVDRPNLKMCVHRRLPTSTAAEESFSKVLEPYIKELCDVKDVPKTIVYTKLKWCGAGYEEVNREAMQSGKYNEIMKCVSQYHAPCTEKMKSAISQDMSHLEGNIKLLFATEAYGMGADAPNVRRIVHIGPPTSLETYLQEIGRAGRDGLNSVAELYFNMSDIGANTNVSTEVREFCLLQSCRRRYICQHFGSYFEPMSVLHNCCDICTNVCDCDDCFVTILDNSNVTTETNDSHEETTHTLVKADEKSCRKFLFSYFEAENMATETSSPELYTGLTRGLINKIVEHFEHINSESDMHALWPYIGHHYVKNIWYLLSSFKDRK